MAVDLFISPTGEVTFVFDDRLMQALGGLGPAATRRASHVEPTADGRHWTADLSPLCGRSVILGPFETRTEALQEEAQWLANYLRQRPEA